MKKIKYAIISEGEEKVSYSQLKKIINKNIFGDNKKCLVLFVCSNTIEAIIGYVTCIYNKLVPIMVSNKCSYELILNYVENYYPSYIYCPSKVGLNYNFSGYKYYSSYKSYIILKKDNHRNYLINNSLALLLTTSGSTGNSKLVRLSYKNISSNTEAIIEYLGITKEDCCVTMLPLNYTYGLSIINTHLKAGGTVFVTEKGITCNEFWKCIEDNRITSLSGVPYTYEILKVLKFDTIKLNYLKYITVAGGKLDNKIYEYLLEYVKKNSLKLYVMYGQTEATARISYLPPNDVYNKIGSVGKSIPGGKIEIDNNNEIIYYGENVSMGYAASYKDVNKGDENKGILHTGDKGYFDKDGYLYISGRKDRFKKLLGHRINLEDVEVFIKKNFCLDSICKVENNKLIIYLREKNCIAVNSRICLNIGKYLCINTNYIQVEDYKNIPRNEYGKIINL